MKPQTVTVKGSLCHYSVCDCIPFYVPALTCVSCFQIYFFSVFCREWNVIFLSDGSFPQLAACVCASLGTVFPELLRSQDRVHSVLLKEEQQFTRTLDKVFLGIKKATICLRQNDSVIACCVRKSFSLNRKARPTSTGHLPRAFHFLFPPFFLVHRASNSH